jgi:TRAP-type C4-dicarboxylate transport system substrate-binding protein
MEKNRKIFSTGFTKKLTANAESTGLNCLGIYVEPFFQLTANRKIEKPEDFRGLKVRTMNSPIILATYKGLGANPTPIPFFEVYSGLQTNLIDAQENPLNIIYEMSFHEVQKYLILTSHSTTVNVLFISQKLFDRMPKNLQEIVMEGGKVAQDYMFSEIPNIQKQAIKLLESSGKITIIESSPAISAAYKKAAEPAKEEFLKIVGEKEGKELLQALKEALKTIE